MARAKSAKHAKDNGEKEDHLAKIIVHAAFDLRKEAGRDFLLRLRRLGPTLVADGYVVGEGRRNLETKFPESVKDFEGLMRDVEASVGVSGPLRAEIAPDLPAKDRPVLAAAIQHRCHILLTGDKTDFGPLYGRTV